MTFIAVQLTATDGPKNLALGSKTKAGRSESGSRQEGGKGSGRRNGEGEVEASSLSG